MTAAEQMQTGEQHTCFRGNNPRVGAGGTSAHKALNMQGRGRSEEELAWQMPARSLAPCFRCNHPHAAAGDGITNQFIRKSTGSPRKRFINKTIRCRAPAGEAASWGLGKVIGQTFDPPPPQDATPSTKSLSFLLHTEKPHPCSTVAAAWQLVLL